MLNLKKVFTYYWRIGRWHLLLLAVPLALGIFVELQHLGNEPSQIWRFLLSLAIDLVPALSVMFILEYVADDFVRAVYGLKTMEESQSFLMRRLFGTPSFKPYLIIKEGKIAADGKDGLIHVGGPGSLVIYNDSAVVLEKAGKLTKVVKKGFGKLDDLEKVWGAVDLRPHRWVFDVNGMTKEGIPITCQADVTLQIDDGGQSPSEEEPFPATEEAIFKAATRKWMREATRSSDDQEFDWARRAIIGMTEGSLRSILATYLLDQLLGPDELNRSDHRSDIRSRLESDLRKSFPDLGVKLIKVELGDIRVANEVAQRRIEAWRTTWKRWAKEREAEGEAERLQTVEAAKALAQADMIVEITQAFQSLADDKAIIPSQFVLLRMFEVLKRTSYDPQSGMLFLPGEVLRTWQLVQDIALGKPALSRLQESKE